MKSNKGFTVIELLLVFAIIGLVAAALLSHRWHSSQMNEQTTSRQVIGDEVKFVHVGDQGNFYGKVLEVVPLVGEHKVVGLKVRRGAGGFLFRAVGAAEAVKAEDTVFCQEFAQGDRTGRAHLRVCHKIPIQ